MKKNFFLILSFIIMAFSLSACSNNEYVNVYIDTISTNHIVATSDNTLTVNDSENNELYSITVMPSQANSENTLKTNKNNTSIINLEIKKSYIQKLGTSLTKLYFKNNDDILNKINQWTYDDYYELQYEVIFATTDIHFTVNFDI